jgi:hypothetical protein
LEEHGAGTGSTTHDFMYLGGNTSGTEHEADPRTDIPLTSPELASGSLGSAVVGAPVSASPAMGDGGSRFSTPAPTASITASTMDSPRPYPTMGLEEDPGTGSSADSAPAASGASLPLSSSPE